MIPPNIPNPVISPIAAPPIAALCKNAKKDPAATKPIEACHPAAKLPKTGPVALKPIAPNMAGVVRQNAGRVRLVTIFLLWILIQAMMDAMNWAALWRTDWMIC